MIIGIAAAAMGASSHSPSAGSATGTAHINARVARAAEQARARVQQQTALARVARTGLPVYCGRGRRPWVALTFDDGPSDLSTGYITILRNEQVEATMFRVGRNISGHESEAREEQALGWDSGSHTQSHVNLSNLNAAEQRRQITEGARSSSRVLGTQPLLFRPPYEAHNATTDRLVRRLGLVQVLWNVDPQDSEGTPTAASVYQRAAAGMRPGSIILLHETKATTVAALPRILAALRRRRLSAVTVSQLLTGDPPTKAQLRKGFAGCQADVTPGKAAA